MPFGTIVDENVIDAGNVNWYMVPHHALKGQARVSHYHVLENDARISPAELKRFAFDLCHLFGRATKVVSRPAHLYFAHLAAERGSMHSSDYRVAGGGWGETGSTGSHGSNSSSAAPVHPNLAKTVYYA